MAAGPTPIGAQTAADAVRPATNAHIAPRDCAAVATPSLLAKLTGEAVKRAEFFSRDAEWSGDEKENEVLWKQLHNMSLQLEHIENQMMR
jgi:hypothetical protein